MENGVLIGRDDERARLATALAAAREGRGGVLLLAGEAGVGKTRLAEAVLRDGGTRLLRGGAVPGGSPYDPVTAAFRDGLRADPSALDDCGPLRSRLALLLPELGPAEPSANRATLVEAIRAGLAAMVAGAPAVVLLDDMQWSDEATLELLAALALPLRDMPLLLVAAYRSDELARAHPLRRLRDDLRRDRALDEITIPPLTEDGTGLLVAELAGGEPSPALVRAIHDRTGGTPFFIEELTATLAADGRLQPSPRGLALDVDGEVPLPRTIRDAVLIRHADLPDHARAAAEVAAVAGTRLDLTLVADAGGEDGVSELLSAGVLVEAGPGGAVFRHPLVREALYEDIPWLRRRAIHRLLAERLEGDGADSGEVAGHWLAARDLPRALVALRAAVRQRGEVHAHRDATALGRRALEIWPEGERLPERIATLEEHARYAELSGDLTEAVRAQREVVAARRTEGAGRALADAERRIASIYALQGDRERALAARRVAAEAFAANGLPGEAAAERIVIAGYHQSAGRHAEAVEAAETARQEAVRAERRDLQARALALSGVAQVKRGAFEEGVATVRTGLSLALEHGLTSEAAEVYQRLGTALEITGDYAAARDALGTALDLCALTGADDLGLVCIGCMTYVLRELGDWEQAQELCASIIVPGASPGDTLVADGVLGALHAWRGWPGDALPLLTRCLETATRSDVVSMACDSLAVLAWIAAEEGDDARVEEHCRALLARWERSEDHHYAVAGLRWAAGWLAQNDRLPLARGCCEGLSAIAASTGHPDALAALACALAETALAEGDVDAAVAQFARALEIHETLEIPFERAQILLRAGVAMAAAGAREAGLERLAAAHRLAAGLGARPVADRAAAAISGLGATLEDHVGARAAAEHTSAGLSRRELEVVRLVADGLTNREIAARLVLSTRTVDMHVRNILTKLRARTRTEAATRASALGLLPGDGDG